MIGAVVEHLWQSTLCVGVAWLLATALRRERAALRHSIWWIASLKFLVPFSLLEFLGSHVDLGLHLSAAGADLRQAASAVIFVAMPGQIVSEVAADYRVIATGLLLIWAAGCMVFLARWLLAAFWARRICESACDIDLGLSIPVRLTSCLTEPAVCGVVRPVILLPEKVLQSLSPPQLRGILAHELCHVERRDNLKAAFQSMVEVLFWFYPPVRWLGRRLLNEREAACDEAVLAEGHGGVEYARAILQVCNVAVGHERAWMTRATGGDLQRRIQFILAARAPRQSAFMARMTVAALATVVYAGPVVAAALRAPSSVLTIDVMRSMGRLENVSLVPSVRSNSRSQIVVRQRMVRLEGASLREIVALAYATDAAAIRGYGQWLDAPRYDIEFTFGPVIQSQIVDTDAYRMAVTKLLAERFNLQIFFNTHCQSPCGRGLSDMGASR